jgi:S-adenosylmethionine:tRNA ribosyltransferase-isomerase
MKPAILPRHGPSRAKLLVIDAYGSITHHAAAALPRFIRRGDLIVANDAATLPASLAATHVRTGQPIEIRLAGRQSLAPDAVTVFTAIVFGAGNYRTLTERRPTPPALAVGDTLVVGPLRPTIVAVHGHPRLIDIRFDDGVDEIWAVFARHGRPIQYSHIQEPVAMWDTWTSIASQPVAFEAPSAGFILNWSMLRALRARHASIASLTHAAGISSTGDPDLDRMLPLDEPYVISPATAALVNRTKQSGGRVLAVGTTVVRALEHASCGMSRVRSGASVATQRIGAHTELRIVDGIVSGMHEPDTSHYELLRAFQGDDALARMAAEAEQHDYRAHEFGDAVFIERCQSNVARAETSLQTGRQSRCLSSTRREQRLSLAEAVEGSFDRTPRAVLHQFGRNVPQRAERCQHAHLPDADPGDAGSKEIARWRSARQRHDTDLAAQSTGKTRDDAGVDEQRREHEVRSRLEIARATIGRHGDALVHVRANLAHESIRARVDDERRAASIGDFARRGDALALFVDSVQRGGAAVVIGILDIDANGAGVEDGINRLGDIARAGAISALDVGRDGNRDGARDFPDCADHGVATDVFGVLKALGIRDAGAGCADGRKPHLFEDSCAGRVPGIRQE